MSALPSVASAGLAWCGVGLLLLADPARARRVQPAAPPSPTGRRARRAAGAAALALSAAPLAPGLGVALAAVTWLWLAATAMSVATLWFPLRPRLYAATVAGAAVAAALAWFGS